MRAAHVVLLAGEGVGLEVVPAARAVLDAAGADIAWDEVDVRGDDVLDRIRAAGVALKGPVGTSIAGERSLNVALRRALDLYVQVRPSRSWPGVGRGGVDLLVVRETTEDLYRGIEVAPHSEDAAELLSWLQARGHELPASTGLSIKPTSPEAVRRAATFTVDLARARGRRRLTIVHKATVMRATDGVFLEVAREVAAQQTDVEVDDRQVDHLVAELVRRPEAYDVLFMPNQYGDIVSDLAAALTGGIGLAPGANHGDGIAVFEPVHGTAPRRAGHGCVNPLAAILSGVLLLRHVGQADIADRIESAVADVLLRGPWTYDVVDGRGDPVSTDALAAAVIDRLP